MKTKVMPITRYDADEGKVFDWANLAEHVSEDPDTHEQIQEHLYASTLFIGEHDNIENYVEVPAPVIEEE